jgi:hypothetical protein
MTEMNRPIFTQYKNSDEWPVISQCAGLVLIGWAIVARVIWKIHELTTAQKFGYVFLLGVALGVVLVLAIVVPALYRKYIKQRKDAGERVLVHQIILVLYYPFLLLLVIFAIAIATAYLMA